MLAAQTYLLGPQPFDTDFLVHGSTASTSVWFAPNYNSPIDFLSTGGCPGSCIGYSGNWNNYWGNFIRMPEVNCTGNDSVVLGFDVSHSFFSSQPNDWCRFYIWADNGYKHVVSGVKINGSNALYNSGANGKGFKFSTARNCAQVEVTFNLTSIINRSNILFYIEPSCGYNNSNTFFFRIDNLFVSTPAPPLVAPGIQASGIVFTNVGTHSFDASWTRGNGSHCLAFLKDTVDGQPFAQDNFTYSASPVFGNGSQIGTSRWYCVYNGTGNSVSLSNLQPNTNYRLMVCEYNGTPGNEKYNIAPAVLNPNNCKTAVVVGIEDESGSAASFWAVRQQSSVILHSVQPFRQAELFDAAGNLLDKYEGPSVNELSLKAGSGSGLMFVRIGTATRVFILKLGLF